MSTLVTKNVQVGADGTASNNFTIYQPSTPDGTVRIGNGNSGSVTDAITLNSSGNVGIGTSSPTFSTGGGIEVAHVSSANLRLNSDVGGAAEIRHGTSLVIETRTSEPLILGTNSTERLRIDTSGNVGIGTSNPVAKTHIKGTGTSGQVTASWILENGSSGTAGMDITGAAGSSRWRFLRSGGPGTGTNSLTEAMCILTEGASAGNVGIGTSSPNEKLVVNGAIRSTNNAVGATATADSGLFYFIPTADAPSDPRTVLQGVGTSGVGASLVFYTGTSASNAERARIDSSGNLLVGNTSSSASPASGFNAYIGGGSTGIAIGHVNGTSSGNYYASFAYNSGVIGSITQNGTTNVSYNTSSDYRLKENIAPMTGALATIAALKPCTYKWKADGSDGQGFIAHELQAVVPDCVTGEKDAVDADGNPQYQGVDTSFLVATLTAAIQEQQAIIESLKARLDAANL